MGSAGQRIAWCHQHHVNAEGKFQQGLYVTPFVDFNWFGLAASSHEEPQAASILEFEGKTEREAASADSPTQD